MEICEGQQWDMEFETRMDVKVEEYIEMIRLKTSVLLAAALKIGACLAGAPAEDAQKLLQTFEDKKDELGLHLNDVVTEIEGA